jgi:hypothetical protein
MKQQFLGPPMFLLLLLAILAQYGAIVEGAGGEPTPADEIINPRDKGKTIKGKSKRNAVKNVADSVKTSPWNKDKHVEYTDKVIVKYTNMFVTAKDVDQIKASC